MIVAARNGRAEIIKALIEAGASLEIKDEYDETALRTAVRYGRTEIANSLIDAGARPDIGDK